jgi:hypothetical protein
MISGVTEDKKAIRNGHAEIKKKKKYENYMVSCNTFAKFTRVTSLKPFVSNIFCKVLQLLFGTYSLVARVKNRSRREC